MRSVRTPEEIRARGLDLWNRQDLLRSELRGESTFPLRFPCSRPSAKDLLGDFSQWKNLYRTLREQAKKASGYGYTLLEETITLRHLGEQTVPVGVIFESANDFYRFIGRHAEHRRWRALVERLLAQEPMLKNWIEAIPLVVLENEEVWERALLVMKFLRMHPRPGIYLRQLEISGIDTKFVEHHKVFLRDLLNQTLPENNIFIHETLLRSGGFERRFGFREEEPVLRFRFLDPTLIRLYHFSDLTLPLSELRDADLKATRIFVTENKINGLAFPQVTGGIVIFGLGYGITCLQNIPWLSSKEIFYWGDIDTHGFSSRSSQQT